MAVIQGAVAFVTISEAMLAHYMLRHDYDPRDRHDRAEARREFLKRLMRRIEEQV